MVHGSLKAGAAVLALMTAGASPAAARGNWLPTAASSHAAGVDGPFFLLYLVAALVVVVVTGLAMTFVMQFRRRDDAERGAPTGRPNSLLLGLWVAGAAAFGLYTFTSGLPGYLDQAVAPYGAYEIGVTARQGDFDFVYPGGHVADTLTVPVGRAVRLTLVSEDVIHGLSVPALRISEAILPDRTGEAWFEATVADTFIVQGNIYSGKGYGDMTTALITLPQADYDAWLQKVSDIFAGRTMAEVGELLYTAQGCKTCHSVDGSKLVGPSFLELYGHSFETREGTTIVADDAYIRESILTPNVSVIAGFEPVMTPYEGKITDREIEAITAWLQTLSSLGGTAEAASDTTDATTGAAAPQEESE